MYCPDCDGSRVTDEDAVKLLFTVHGRDLRSWPAAVPDHLKELAKVSLAAEAAPLVLCTPFPTDCSSD